MNEQTLINQSLKNVEINTIEQIDIQKNVYYYNHT